jgi:hypothetical protein
VRLLIDEGIASDELMARLKKAGHDVERVEKSLLDDTVWRHAQDARLTLVTANPDDFVALASATPRHHGLLLVYGERDPLKQMRAADIASAIGHVQDQEGDHLSGRSVVLNEWRRPPRQR